MLKVGKNNNGVELFSPHTNMIYNISETTWEIIKSVKKYGKEKAIQKNSSLFNISEKESKEDIETVLKNLKKLNINLNELPIDLDGEKLNIRIVHFDITSKCNSKCIYCLSSNRIDRKGDLSTKKILETIKELNDLGMWVLTISGGEPLLRRDIFEILDCLKKINIPIRFFTNGILINDTIAEKLSHYKDLMTIQISLDSSNAEHHDAQRGVKGSFEKTVKGIKNLMKYNCVPVISTVITQLTLKDVEETADFLHELGINYVRIGDAKICSEASISNKKIVNLKLDQARALGKKIISINRKYKSSMKFSLSPHMINCPQDPNDLHDMPFCTAGVTSLYISPSGEVYPCIALSEPELKVGDIKKDSVINIWNKSSLLKELRKLSVDDFEKCKSCDVKDICKGGCRGSSYENFKSLKSYDPIYCSYFNK